MSIREAQAFLRTTGYAKPSQYALYFTGPFDIIPITASKRLTINCEECFFPSKNLFTADVRHYGHSYKYPYSHEFTNEVTMIFRIGSDMYEKRVFEEWINMAVDKNTHNHSYYDEYTSNIGIAQIDPTPQETPVDNQGLLDGIVDRFQESFKDQFGFNGNREQGKEFTPIGGEKIVYQCVLEKAYPIGIMELPMGHGSTDTYHRIGITFTFKKWYSLPELVDGDLRSQSLRNTAELGSDIDARQKQGVNGKVIDVLTRGASVYGPAFKHAGGTLQF